MQASSVSHKYAAASTYKVTVTGYATTPVTGSVLTVPQTSYRITVDLNGGYPAKITTSGITLYSGGTTKTESTFFDSTLPIPTNPSPYACCICRMDIKLLPSGESKTIECNGVIRETRVSSNEYFYFQGEKTLLDGYIFDSNSITWLPSGEYKIYTDRSFVCESPKSVYLGHSSNGRVANLLPNKPMCYVYDVNPVWIPLDSVLHQDGDDDIELVCRCKWKNG